jgi:hypothetical protein
VALHLDPPDGGALRGFITLNAVHHILSGTPLSESYLAVCWQGPGEVLYLLEGWCCFDNSFNIRLLLLLVVTIASQIRRYEMKQRPIWLVKQASNPHATVSLPVI